MLVPRSSATVAIETFITELSSIIRNCPAQSVSRISPAAAVALPFMVEAGPVQVPRSFAFWAANSSSVRMPCDFSSPSSFSCSIIDGARRPGRAPAGPRLAPRVRRRPAASCCAQRDSWRRRTRPLTAVAVPATAAVRAIPLSSPGMLPLFSGLDRVERGEHGLDRDPAAGDQLAAAAPDGDRERRRPGVLVDEQRRPRSRAPSPRAASSRSLSSISPEEAPSKTASSASSRRPRPPRTAPSSPLAMKTRSRIRIRPRSTRSTRCGASSPFGCRPDHSTSR